MKVFVMDLEEGMGIDLAVRAQDAGHQVRYWTEDKVPWGNGLIPKVQEWKPQMDWADLIVLTGNCNYPKELDAYFGRGYPIFGTNAKAAELELDRAKGQEVLKKYGIKTAAYTVVDSVKEAVKLITKTGQAYAMKPWGGEADKAMTFVTSDPNESIFILQKWEKEGKFSGQLMMQEMIKGIEMGVAGWFGPGGWSEALEESFEHKKFLNDDLGENTGEMGTVIRHVRKSKLFDMVLEPLTDYFHLCNYIGDVDVNCIIDEKGNPWPLEFTVRLGWPDFTIRQEVTQGDPVDWMRDLIGGRDTLEVSTDVSVGVVLTHGDFPKCKDPPKEWTGYPIQGIDSKTYPHLHYQQVALGEYPVLDGKAVKTTKGEVTAGTYVMVVTGAGKTVESAAKKAYDVAWNIKWPSNVMFRTDIGKRLEEELPKLHKHGFAEGMKYGS